MLARYQSLLGREEHIKPDTPLDRLFDRMTGWTSRLGRPQDMATMQTVVQCVARQLSMTPTWLNNILWLSESLGLR